MNAIIKTNIQKAQNVSGGYIKQDSAMHLYDIAL